MKRLACLLALAVVGSSAAVVDAGSVKGPGRDVFTIPAYGRVTYYGQFRGGELAEVVLDGDGSTDLDIYIYDENNNMIVRGIGPTDYERVTWRPRWTGRFRIVVVNLGNRPNTYILRTN
jgi:hypothetical protein